MVENIAFVSLEALICIERKKRIFFFESNSNILCSELIHHSPFTLGTSSRLSFPVAFKSSVLKL